MRRDRSSLVFINSGFSLTYYPLPRAAHTGLYLMARRLAGLVQGNIQNYLYIQNRVNALRKKNPQRILSMDLTAKIHLLRYDN